MNKTVIIVLVIIILGGVFSFLLKDENSIASKAQIVSAITADKNTYDFGRIEIFDGKVSTEYVLTNIGEEDVEVTSAITSCMCTEGELVGMTFGMHSGSEIVIIPAGGSEILTATYDPLAHGPSGTGKVKRELILTTNSSVTPSIVVTFTADVYKE